MWFRQFLIDLIKRLPFILSIALTPLLFIWIVYYHPEVLELFHFSSSPVEERRTAEEPGRVGHGKNNESRLGMGTHTEHGSGVDSLHDAGTKTTHGSGMERTHKSSMGSITDDDRYGDAGKGNSGAAIDSSVSKPDVGLPGSRDLKSRYVREHEAQAADETHASTKIDWAAKAEKCTDAKDFCRLAEEAATQHRYDLELRYLLKAIDLDPDSAKAKQYLANIRFDPEMYLTDFSTFEGQQMEGFLEPFKARSIRNLELPPSRLKELCAMWEPVRAKLQAELKARESDPFETNRKNHLLRLQAQSRFRFMRYALCRVYEPFRLFIDEGLLHDEMPASFSEPLAGDLLHALSGFEKRYTVPENGWKEKERVFFVWVLHKKKSFSVEFDAAYRMLKIELPDGLKPGNLTENERREIVNQFCRMLIDTYTYARGADEGRRLWRTEGIPFLFSQGGGTDDEGRLILNEPSETVNTVSFSQWIEAGGLKWPIPLRRLIEFTERTTLKTACNNGLIRERPELRSIGLYKVFDGALEASRFFCLYLYQENDASDFFDYARMKLAGLEAHGSIIDWLASKNWTEVEQEMIRRYASPEVVSRAIRKKTLPQEEIEPPLEFDPGVKLLKPGLDAASLRSMVIHLVRGHGCFDALEILKEALCTAGLDPASPNLAPGLARLEEGVRIEEALLGGLAEKRLPLYIDDEKRILIEAGKGRFRCKTTTGDVESEHPVSAIEPSKWIFLCKNKLKLKKDEDRIGYGSLYLLYGDIADFRKEMNFIRGRNDRKEALEGEADEFAVAAAGADVIGLLSVADENTDVEAFAESLIEIKGTPLLKRLLPDAKRFMTSCLTHQYMAPDENGFLAKTYAGYAAAESDENRAVFLYAFADARELGDFEREPPPFFTMLNPNQTPYPDSRPFDLRDGKLTAFGTAFFILKPVFTGSIVLKASFEYLGADEQSLGSDPALHIGYGLGSASGVVSASDFFHLCTQSLKRGGLELHEGRKIYAHILPHRTYSIALEGERDEIRVFIDDAKVLSADLPGLRNGKVFIQDHFPFGFWLKFLEVRAEIDKVWLRKKVEAMAESRLAGMLSRLP